LQILLLVTAVKTLSKDSVDHSDHELERSEIWNTVFVSGSMQRDGPIVKNTVRYSISLCLTLFPHASLRWFDIVDVERQLVLIKMWFLYPVWSFLEKSILLV